MPGNAAGIKRSETSNPFAFGGWMTVRNLRSREIREGGGGVRIRETGKGDTDQGRGWQATRGRRDGRVLSCVCRRNAIGAMDRFGAEARRHREPAPQWPGPVFGGDGGLKGGSARPSKGCTYRMSARLPVPQASCITVQSLREFLKNSPGLTPAPGVRTLCRIGRNRPAHTRTLVRLGRISGGACSVRQRRQSVAQNRFSSMPHT